MSENSLVYNHHVEVIGSFGRLIDFNALLQQIMEIWLSRQNLKPIEPCKQTVLNYRVIQDVFSQIFTKEQGLHYLCH